MNNVLSIHHPRRYASPQADRDDGHHAIRITYNPPDNPTIKADRRNGKGNRRELKKPEAEAKS
jgi:hypothetical protein